MTLVFLADDDILTLNRLRNIIDWNGNGYEIAGQARTGTDTLLQVEKLQPDILILDVDMPDKNGIEVTKALHSRNSKTFILILSNYDTFEFVRETMRYGACDYLLKHQLEPELLLQKLNELKERKTKEGLHTSHMYYFANVAKQQYLKELLQYGITEGAEHEHMLTQKDFSSKYNVLAVMQITNFIILTHFSPSINREKLIDSVINLAVNIFTSIHNGIIAHMEYGQFVVLFHFNQEVSHQKILETASSHMKLLLSNMKKLLNITAYYQVGSIIYDLKNLKENYRKTTGALNLLPFDKGGENTTAQAITIDITEEKNLVDALMAMDISRTEYLLKAIFQHYSDTAKGLWISQPLILQLLQIGQKIVKSRKLSVSLSDEDMLNQLQREKNNEGIYQLLWNYYKEIMTAALNQKYLAYSPHVRNAILYIRENYASSDLSLVTVAKKIHVSSAHLSRVFKKETGISFIDYLTTFRIDLARQMIKNTDTGLKEISDQIGFHSYNYFLRVFKEKTGHTPSQEAAVGNENRNQEERSAINSTV